MTRWGGRRSPIPTHGKPTGLGSAAATTWLRSACAVANVGCLKLVQLADLEDDGLRLSLLRLTLHRIGHLSQLPSVDLDKRSHDNTVDMPYANNDVKAVMKLDQSRYMNHASQ